MRLEHMKQIGLALLLALPLTVAPSWADEHEQEDGGWIAKARERVSSAVGRLGQLDFGGGRFYVGFTGGQTSLDLDDGVNNLPLMTGVTPVTAATRRAELVQRLGSPMLPTTGTNSVAADGLGVAPATFATAGLDNISFSAAATARTVATSELDDDADSSFKLYAGYQLNDMVAVEAFYVDHGSYDVDVNYALSGIQYRDQAATQVATTNVDVLLNVTGTSTSSLSYDSSAFGVTVPIGWQVHPNVRAFVKVGLTFWDVEVDEDAGTNWALSVAPSNANNGLILRADGALPMAVVQASDTAAEKIDPDGGSALLTAAMVEAAGGTAPTLTADNVDDISLAVTGGALSVLENYGPRGTAEDLDLDEADDGVGFHFGVGADFSYGDLPLNIRVEYEGWTSDPASGNFSIGLHYLF